MPEYKLLLSKILGRIYAVRRLETMLQFIGRLLLSCALACMIILSISAVEMVARGNETFRTVIALLAFVGFHAAMIVYLLPAIKRAFSHKHKPSTKQIALRIGEKYPEIKDRLCNVMQLAGNIESQRGISQDLAVAAFLDVAKQTEPLDFKAIIDKKESRRGIFAFFIVAVITGLLMGVFVPSLGEAFGRIVNFNKSYLPPAPFSLTIEPLDASVLRGGSQAITIKADGEAPDKVTLFIKEEQQENFDAITLRQDSTGFYNYKLTSLRKSVIFYAESPWLTSAVKTPEGRIRVLDRPSVRSMAGRITFPAYTGLASKDFDEQSADFSALRGTEVSLTVFTNKDLSEAQIYIEKSNSDSSKNSTDTAIVEMRADGRKAVGSFHIASSCSYYVKIRDIEGEANIDPIKYSIIATNDEYPTISLIEPRADIELGDEASVSVRAAVSDDYGFSSLKLYYRLVYSKFVPPSEDYRSINIPLHSSGNTAEAAYLWDLNDIGLSPEDKYEFYLEVADNDRVSGPKTARTRTVSVRLLSLDEALHAADQNQNVAEKELQNILKKAENVKKDMEELNRELLKKPNQKEMDWKEKKKMEDIIKNQQELQKKISDVQNELNEATQKLNESRAISPETMEKYMELQKLLKEVNSDELKALQDKMKQALESMSPEQLQKMMKQAEFNEEQFRKSIERTMKILKRIKAEQKADAIAKRAEELARKQEELEQKMQNTNPDDQKQRKDLAKRQENNREDLNKMSKDIKDLEDIMKEIGKDMPLDEMKDAKDELDMNETSQDMDQSKESMQNGDFQKAGKKSNSAQKKLKKFAEKMKNVKQSMDNKNKKEAMRKMQKAINNLVELSQKQEDLKNQTQSTDYNSTQFPELAEQQSEIFDGLQNVANSMMDLSQKSFAVTPEMARSMGEAMQQMSQAMQELSNRIPQNASSAQNKAMTSMNQGTLDMQAMMQTMQKNNGSCSNPGGEGQGQGQGAGGFGERMQQLAAQQQAINQAMQQAAGQSGSMSQEQQAQLGRLAAEQGKAKKSLEELAREQKQITGGERALGNLEKIAQEMKESMNDIQNNRITPETYKRQERILSRLLDASKSIHDRDFEKKREAKSADNIFGRSAGDIDLSTQEGKTRAFQELLRSIQQGYTKDYETLIRQYFESLQTNEVPVD